MPPPDNHGQDMRPAELMDAAQQEVLLSQDAIAATRAHARAHAAMAAASRVAEGTYGICQACGRRIPPRRLLAVPLTRFCLPCQDLQEQRGRDRYRLDEEDE
jgi:RNA polymerase-binding transcription factor DksA